MRSIGKPGAMSITRKTIREPISLIVGWRLGRDNPFDFVDAETALDQIAFEFKLVPVTDVFADLGCEYAEQAADDECQWKECEYPKWRACAHNTSHKTLSVVSRPSLYSLRPYGSCLFAII